jgi:hypothetical protein
MVGKHLGDEVEVTLKRPVPLDTPLELIENGETGTLFHRDAEIAAARVVELELEVEPAVTFEQAAAARASYPGYRNHPFPRCFVCGTDRSCGDGLCLFTGRMAEGIVASSWVPSDEFADERGTVGSELVCAALDCPGAWAIFDAAGITEPYVLGRMTYRIDRPVVARDRYVVMGWALGCQGRKAFCGTGVYDAEGRICAAAHATWIRAR